MSTWQRGRELLIDSIRRDGLELQPFITDSDPPTACTASPRTAVYAVADPDTVPQALLHNLKHNQVLHERNVILTVRVPRSALGAVRGARAGRAAGPGLLARAAELRLHEHARRAQGAGAAAQRQGLPINLFETSYFLSRETVVPTPGAGMAHWRERCSRR